MLATAQTTCAVCGGIPVRICMADWPDARTPESEKVALCKEHETRIRRHVRYQRQSPGYARCAPPRTTLGRAAQSERHIHAFGMRIARATHAANVRHGNA